MQNLGGTMMNNMEIDNMKGYEEGFEKQKQEDPWNLNQRRKKWGEQLKTFKQERNIEEEVKFEWKGQSLAPTLGGKPINRDRVHPQVFLHEE